MDLEGAIFIVGVAILIIVSVSLGIFLGNWERSTDNNTQSQANVQTQRNADLNKIERSIRESTCIGILAIAVAAILAAGTLSVDVAWRLFLYITGVAGIVYSITRFLRR